jgi:DNA-binding CsgD family transcriptional regulator
VRTSTTGFFCCSGQDESGNAPHNKALAFEEITVVTRESKPGVVFVDAALHPLALNEHAIQILTFPGTPGKIKRLEVFLADKMRSELVDRQSTNGLRFVKAFKSGKRRYVCRTFLLDCRLRGAQTGIALLLERHSSNATALSTLSNQFELTGRECEVVELLVQGLTTKDIAIRMNISPNTVKSFLRLVMMKMGVSTRAGIVGRVARPQTIAGH